jgi:hypothetical protein
VRLTVRPLVRARAVALGVAAAVAVVPGCANAFVEVCTHPTDSVWVCHAPERKPGCVYGSLGAEANFSTDCGD